jgi:hypothetical protein
MAEIGIPRKRHRRGRPDGEIRRALQEADKFSDVAGTSYASAVRRTAVALADRLPVQRARGLIGLDDGDGAAGMLLGMVASAARRHLRRPVTAGRVRNRSAGSHLCGAIFAGLPSTRNSRNSQPLKRRACQRQSWILPATRSMKVRHRKRPNTPPNVAGYGNSSSSETNICLRTP